VFNGHSDWVEGIIAIRRNKLTPSASHNSSGSSSHANQALHRHPGHHGDHHAPGGHYQHQQHHEQQPEPPPEALATAGYSGREVLYSWGADGKVVLWELDAEQNCDIYRPVVGGCRWWVAAGGWGC
jgi:hypothetical protein